MPSDRSAAALIDIRFNIVLIDQFVGALTIDAFERDLKTLYATIRALEIISEASRRLPDTLRDRYPEIPWKEIRDAGNKYRHEYDGVAASLIWKTATKSLPHLLAVVEAELSAEDRDRSEPTGT